MDMAKPIIRFKGYQDDWEQRKFGEIVEKYEDPVETPTEGYTRLGIRSHAKGTFHSFVEKGKELETAKMFRVAADKFIVNITFGWEHAVAITDENDAGKLVSHRFPQYSFNAGMVPKFFRYLILDENFKHHLELSSPGGAGRNRVLKLSDMLEYKMNFPSEAEQKKIAAYFDDLDHLITLHQRKCDETKRLKKYMLQKMFPQNGEKVPEIRFSGFTDDWEQRKLGDLTEELSEYATMASGLPLLTSSRSGLMYQSDFRDRKTTTSDETLFSIVPKGSCTYRHMSDDDIFHLNINVLEKGLVSREYPVFISSENNDLEFIIQHINSSDRFRAFCKGQKKGGTRTRLYYKTLCEFEMMIPSIEEQKKISATLHSLDYLITLHQRELENLQNIKKFMLGKMFV